MMNFSKLLKLLRVRLFQLKWWSIGKFKFLFQSHFIALYLGSAITSLLLIIDKTWLRFSVPTDSSLFWSAGGLVGGALAIIVTLNTLLLQNALSKLPARIYKRSTDNNWLNFIYLCLSCITLALFCLGITYLDQAGMPNGFYLRIAIILIAWALILIFIYLRVVIYILDPSKQILKIADHIKSKVDETEKVISSYTNIVSTTPDQDVVVEAGVRSQLTPRINDILSDLNDLSGLYRKLYERGDTQLALTSLHTITSTIRYIYHKRRNNALALPTEYPLTPKSDLSDISLKVDEILLPIWKRSIANDELETIREVLNGYRHMIIASIKVKHRNYRHDNPLITYTIGGLENLINFSIQQKNIDAMFHGSEVLKDIAISLYETSSENRYASASYEKCFGIIQKVYLTGMVNNMSGVKKLALESSMYMIASAVISENMDNQIRTVAAESFSKILTLANAKVNSSELVSGDEIAITENLIRVVFGSLPERLRKTDIRKLTFRIQLMLDAIVASFRSNAKHVNNISFERFIELAGRALIDMLNNHSDKLWPKDKERIYQIFDLMNEICKLSVKNYDYDETANGNSEIYTKKLAMIGLDAANLNDKDRASSIISTLFDIASWLLQQANSVRYVEYEAIRAVRYAGLISAISHTNRRYEISRLYKSKLHAFEEDWLNAIFPDGFEADRHYIPSPNELRSMYDGALDDRSFGVPRFLETVEEVAHSYLSRIQLDVFESYIWRDRNPPQ